MARAGEALRERAWAAQADTVERLRTHSSAAAAAAATDVAAIAAAAEHGAQALRTGTAAPHDLSPATRGLILCQDACTSHCICA